MPGLARLHQLRNSKREPPLLDSGYVEAHEFIRWMGRTKNRTLPHRFYILKLLLK